MTVMKKTRGKNCWKGHGSKGPCTLLVGIQIGTTIMETVRRFFKEFKIELSCDPATPTAGCVSKGSEASLPKRQLFIDTRHGTN
jgi:hypothetical protein